jgi:hypothetical protein
MRGQGRRPMRLNMYSAVLGMLALFAGCGGGGTGGGGGGTTITVQLDPLIRPSPPPMALKVGSGPFMSIFPQSSQQVSFTVPSVTEPYALAWECDFGLGRGLVENFEFVLESTAQDATSYTMSCSGPFGSSGQLGLATGTVDASAIVGTGTTSSSTEIYAKGGLIGSVFGGSGSFNAHMPVGLNDVAFVVFTDFVGTVGVKILRGQPVPGAINGGTTVTLGPSDVPTTQPFSVTNIPAGFDPPGTDEEYFTAGPNGTNFFLEHPLAQYQVVPAASAQNGDGYTFIASTSDTATHNSVLIFSESITSGGGPVTVALPAPWSYTGPTPAALTTFNLNYSGVPGLATVTQQVRIDWPSSAPFPNFGISVRATGSYQNGTTTITIPDLSGVSGFFGPASSGTSVAWRGIIEGGALPLDSFFPTKPHTDGSWVEVINSGSYVVP